MSFATQCPTCSAAPGVGCMLANGMPSTLPHWRRVHAEPVPAADAPIPVVHAWLVHGADTTGRNGTACPDGCDEHGSHDRLLAYQVYQRDDGAARIVEEIGCNMNDADDWIAVALACIDQAMVPVAVQDRIAKILDAVQS